MLRFICLFLLFLVHGTSIAQPGQARFWYFGTQAGLDFGTNPPTPLTNGALTAFEGCASISDINGNLQFYTNGNQVWDRTHQVMPNGTGLNGDGLATQATIIVPAPANTALYYLFTVDTNGGPRGLCYSVVDMNLNNGFGEVTSKNNLLATPVTEKLTAVRHANGVDAWVVVHGWNNSTFMAYPITAAGVGNTAVQSNIGSVHGGNFINSHGYLKSSPDASKLACVIRGPRVVEVFDFNNASGQISNPLTISYTPQVYGAEFSPDGRYLYVTGMNIPGEVFQTDLMAGNPAAVAGSTQVVGSHNGLLGALQAGIDQRIYVCHYLGTSLGVISQPNLPGIACGFNPASLSLGGRSSGYGLPNFLQQFFIVADFTYADTCSGSATAFTSLVAVADSMRWDFGDPLSGASNNTSSLNNPTHVFSSAGTYTVTLIAWEGLLSDTVQYTLEIIDTPEPDFGPDSSSCAGNPVLLDPGSFAGALYDWSDGSTGPTLTVTNAGDYSVTINRGGCIGRDTISVLFYPIPVFSFGTDQSICTGETITLTATNSAQASVVWQDGSTLPYLTITAGGTYSATVTENSCSFTDEILIQEIPGPVVFFGNDTTICKGFPLFLDATNPGASYIWQNGSTDPFIFAEDPGSYAVIVTVGSCTASDTILIDQQEEPVVFLGEDSLLCSGQPIELNAFNYGAVYSWQDGSNTASFRPEVSGNYWVTATNKCGIAGDSILVTFVTCNCLVYLPSAFTPNRDNRNETYGYEVNCTDFNGTFEIYDRFGALLFSSNMPEETWDGTYQGKECTEGVYIHVLKYSGYDNGRLIKEKKRGTFLLLR
jgi:gliding motility-associated-like protein